jgi:hypothetical protein
VDEKNASILHDFAGHSEKRVVWQNIAIALIDTAEDFECYGLVTPVIVLAVLSLFIVVQ